LAPLHVAGRVDLDASAHCVARRRRGYRTSRAGQGHLLVSFFRRPRPWRRPPYPSLRRPRRSATPGGLKKGAGARSTNQDSSFLRFFWSNSGVDFRRQSGVGPSGPTIGREIIDRRAGLSREESPWPSTARTALNSSARSPGNSLGRRDPSWARQAPRSLPRPDPGRRHARARQELQGRHPAGIGFVAASLGSPLKVSRHSLQACRHWAVGAE
jgi:hypothetical protein